MKMPVPDDGDAPSGQAVDQARSSHLMLAKHLASAPSRNLALNGRSHVHARAGAELTATWALEGSNAAAPESAQTSIGMGKPGIGSEGRVEASPTRTTATKRYVPQWILRSAYASVRQHLRHVAT